MPATEITEDGITELLRQNHQDASIPEYLRTMACVHFETGRRVMPRYIDDEVFRFAAAELERLEASVWELGAKVLSLEAALSAALSAQAEPVAEERNELGYTAAEWHRQMSEPYPMVRTSYQQIIDIVDDCMRRRDKAGESNRMMAKWISEGINAARPPCDSRTEAVEEVAAMAEQYAAKARGDECRAAMLHFAKSIRGNGTVAPSAHSEKLQRGLKNVAASLSSRPPELRGPFASRATTPTAKSELVALERALDFIETLTADPLLMGVDDIEMRLEDVQDHARIELESIRRLVGSPVNDASIAARFNRLHGICSRILWTSVGIPAIDNPQTKRAMDDLSEYLFMAGVDAALSHIEEE